MTDLSDLSDWSHDDLFAAHRDRDLTVAVIRAEMGLLYAEMERRAVAGEDLARFGVQSATAQAQKTPPDVPIAPAQTLDLPAVESTAAVEL